MARWCKWKEATVKHESACTYYRSRRLMLTWRKKCIKCVSSTGQQAVGVPAQRKGNPPDHCWGERQEAGRQAGQQLDCSHAFSQRPGFEINSYLQKLLHCLLIPSFDTSDIVDRLLQVSEVKCWGKLRRQHDWKPSQMPGCKHAVGLLCWEH